MPTSDKTGIAFWSVVGFTILALCSILALFAASFGAGFDLVDESLFVVLLSAPRTFEASMDQMIWGQLLAPFSWTIVHLRWLSVIGTTISVGLLAAAVFRWMGPLSARRSDRLLSYAVAAALSLFGALFYFTCIRPAFHYMTTLVMMPCLFVAAMLWRQTLSAHSTRLCAFIIMAAACAIGLLAKPTTPVFLLVIFLGFNLIEGRGLRDTFSTLGLLVVATLALLALTIPLGYDPQAQALFVTAAAASSHDPLRLAGDAMFYGGRIFIFAVSGAAALAILSRGAGAPDRYGKWLLTGLLVLSVGLLARDVFLGRLSPGTADYSRNHGEILHAFVVALILDRFAPLLSARWRGLQRIFPPRPATSDDRRMAALVLALYGACLAGIAGTNTGMWQRSIMNMGPLLLLSAVFLLRRFKEGKVNRWALSAMIVPFYVLLFPPLYVNQYLRPTWIEPIPKETVRLDHPAVLRGLWVTPDIAHLQQRLERQLRAVGFNPSTDRILPGDHRPGMVLLAGGKSLGTPWTMSNYKNADRWNCLVIREGLRQPVRRIIGIDLWTLGQKTLDCLSAYGNTRSIAKKITYGEVVVITTYAGLPGSTGR